MNIAVLSGKGGTGKTTVSLNLALALKSNYIDCDVEEPNAAILVTEPSKFGLHDLKMAVELVKMYKIPFGIVINKDDGKENIVKKYCKKEVINILGTIAYSKDTAVLYSKGKILYDDLHHKTIFDTISKEVLLWN